MCSESRFFSLSAALNRTAGYDRIIGLCAPDNPFSFFLGSQLCPFGIAYRRAQFTNTLLNNSLSIPLCDPNSSLKS